jgi:N-acylneuraminate cytidylyltransferase
MILAFIPARCGSKSIKLKNIKAFCGRPLIYWGLKSLQDAEMVDEIFVATDGWKIADIVKGFDFPKVRVYMRERTNARDISPTEAVMLEFINNHALDDKDIFLLLQATSPFTQPEDIDEALKKYREEKVDSMLSCVRVKRFFWEETGKPLNYDYLTRPRRQDFNGVLMENGAFYINTVGNIKKFKNRLSGRIGIYEMPGYTGIELDEKSDWPPAERAMRNHVIKRESQIKLFLSDVDGTLTDGGMYYGENGEEFKKFNTQDGMAFEMMRNIGIKTGIVTGEETSIITNRAEKLKVDYVYQGVSSKGKIEVAKKICNKEGITFSEIAYIGDDINCKELLESVALAACPANATSKIKEIPGIISMAKSGGQGAVREFVDFIIERSDKRR